MKHRGALQRGRQLLNRATGRRVRPVRCDVEQREHNERAFGQAWVWNLQVGLVQLQRLGVDDVEIECAGAVGLGANSAVRAFDLVQRGHELTRREGGNQRDHRVGKGWLIGDVHGRGVIDAGLRLYRAKSLQVNQRRLKLLGPVSEIAAQSNVIQHGATVGEKAREPYHAQTVTQPAECRPLAAGVTVPSSQPVIHDARSILAVPLFSLNTDVRRHEAMLLHDVRSALGTPMWIIDDDPDRIDELEPAFERRLASHDRDDDNDTPAELSRLRLDPAVVRAMHDLRVRPVAEEDALELQGPTRVQLVIFPGGVAYMLFWFHWNNEQCACIDVDALSLRLNTLRLLHGRVNAEGVRWHGLWCFGDPLPEEWRATWRETVCPFGHISPVAPLDGVVQWLLGGVREHGLQVVRSEYAFHHSTVVLAHAADREEMDRALFLVGHALRPDNEPPPSIGAMEEQWQPRGNRVLVASHEGVLSMSWPQVDCLEPSDSFEVRTWPAVFEGLMLALHLLARAERASLARLARDASIALAAVKFAQENGDDPKGESNESRRDRHNRQDEQDQRDIELVLRLVRRSTRLAIQLVGDDCGGLTEYRQFYRSVRRVLGTANLVGEVRTEIRELYDLASIMQQRIRTRNTVEQTRLERMSNELDRAFQQRFSQLSIVAVSFAIVSGLFGMNVEVPPLPFWTIVFGCIAISAVLVVYFVVDFQRRARAQLGK